MDQTTIILHWKGPFTIEDIQASDEGNGLYLFAGKRKFERTEQIQYCGITEGLYRNRFRDHMKLSEITRELSVWLGHIVYPKQASRHYLEMAETIIVYFWQPNLNERKKYTPPKPTTLISQWYTVDAKPRINQKQIYKYLWDVLSWDGEYWRTGNLSVWSE